MDQNEPRRQSRPGEPGRLCLSDDRFGYCLTCAETVLIEALIGSPFSLLTACVSWKSSAAPNSKRGGSASASTLAKGFPSVLAGENAPLVLVGRGAAGCPAAAR